MGVCQSCGACCAYFRVAFYWREAEPENGAQAVPSSLCEDLDSFRRAMKGTNTNHHRRCVALQGKLGEKVGCTIYANRPNPCRAFEASWESGKRNPRCDDARIAAGLAPISRPTRPKVEQEPELILDRGVEI